MVILEFNNDVNMDSATIEINGMLDLIKPSWSDAVGTPMVMRLKDVYKRQLYDICCIFYGYCRI